MKKSWKRSLSLLIAAVMVIAMLPASALALDPVTPRILGECCPSHDTSHTDWTVLGEEGTVTDVNVVAFNGGGNFVLAGDIKLGATLNVAADTHICLNGHTITSAATGNTNMFTVKDTSTEKNSPVTMTLCDCQGGGSVDADGTGTGGTIIEVGENGTLNFEGGKLTGKESSTGGAALRVNHATAVCNMRGGEISGNKCTATGGTAAHSVFINNGGTFNMSGGVITGNTPASNTLPSVNVFNGTAVFSNTAVCTDGLIKGTYTVKELAEGARIESTNKAATTDDTVSTSGSFVYTYKAPAEPVAMIGATTYDTLEEAITAAQAATTATVKVLKDTTWAPTASYTFNYGKHLTLDLNGCTVSVNYTGTGRFIDLRAGTATNRAEFTITDTSAEKDGVIDADNITAQAFMQLGSYSKFTLEAGKITNMSGSAGGAVVRINSDGAEFIMNGGEISGNGTTAAAAAAGAVLLNNATATFTMTGGKITNNTGAHNDVYRMAGAVDISGSAYVDTLNAPAASVSIGELTKDAKIVSVNKLTVSSAVQEAGSGPYTYTYKTPVAMIGSTNYYSWADAFAAVTASGSGTIKLMQDVTSSGATTFIPAGVDLTIDLNGKTYYATGTQNVFETARDATATAMSKLTITDTSAAKTGKVDASAVTAGDTIVRVNAYGVFTLAGGKLTGKTEGANGAAVRVYQDNAAFVMTGGIITGNASKAAGGAGGVYVYKGTFTMSGGEISGNTNKEGSFDVETGSGTTITLSGNAKVDTIGAGGNITLGDLTAGAKIVSEGQLAVNATAQEAGTGPYTYTYIVSHAMQNVRLQDLIKVGYYFTAPANANSVGALLWTKEAYEADNDRTVNSTSATIYSDLVADAAGYYIVETDGVKAQNLDRAYVMIPYALVGGEYIYGEAEEYSALDYAKTVYEDKAEDPDFANARTLIIDLLNYAAAARNYFYTRDGKTDTAAPLNDILSATDKVVNWNNSMRAGYGAGTTDGTLNIDRYGRSASLLEAIQLNVFYTGDSFSGAKYWLDVNNKSEALVSPAIVGGQAMTKVSIPEIYSFNIYDAYSIQPYEGGEIGNTTVTSVAAYLTKVVDNTNNDDACIALAKAMMVYGYNAETNPLFNQ